MIKAGHFKKKREVNTFECYAEELFLLFGVLLCEQSLRCSLKMCLHSFSVTYISLSTYIYKEMQYVL